MTHPFLHAPGLADAADPLNGGGVPGLVKRERHLPVFVVLEVHGLLLGGARGRRGCASRVDFLAAGVQRHRARERLEYALLHGGSEPVSPDDP